MIFEIAFDYDYPFNISFNDDENIPLTFQDNNDEFELRINYADD